MLPCIAALSRSNCILGETLPEACIISIQVNEASETNLFISTVISDSLTLYSLISSLTELRSSACSLNELIFPLIRLNSYRNSGVNLTSKQEAQKIKISRAPRTFTGCLERCTNCNKLSKALVLKFYNHQIQQAFSLSRPKIS